MLELNGWDLNLRFSASHFIPFHTKCSRLHGHDYGIIVRIYGTLNDKYMLMDFIEIKQALRELIEMLDHHVLIPKKSEFMDVEIIENKVIVSFSGKEYVFPREDVVLLDLNVTTAESLAEYLLNLLIAKNIFGPNIEKVELGIEEGKGQGSFLSKNIKSERK
jgi:6-pyruvoyltetrahydropterin/6-carboxytetrahydropterin synthase